MDKFSFISLWDAYQGLLTDYQREITDMYFNLDLTLSEIAQEKGISRQAVSDCLKNCKTQLSGYEDKLHLVKRLFDVGMEQSFRLTDITKWADGLLSKNPGLSQDIARLKDILDKDYTGEVDEVWNNPRKAEILTKDYTQEAYGKKKSGEE